MSPRPRPKDQYHALTRTLTFLFSDLEGSTALVRRLGDAAYADVLAGHHRVVREALSRWGGEEEGTQGDAFFATFESASAGVGCAVDIERRLLAHPWPDGVRVRVRIGVHTGEARENETGLVGYEVHRAARIAAVGHGGQVLLSAATAGLVESTLDEGVGLIDLGPHRLKDLGRPETIFQVAAPDLDASFPPLRSLDNPELANNLPASLSPFVGRTQEVTEVVARVRGSRLITLAGAGGAGKTRLALQAAAELLEEPGDGVWLVELAPLTNPQDVIPAVLTVFGVQPDADESPEATLVRALRGLDALVILDNCEHVVDEVAKVADLVGRGAPRVRILATSREPLGVGGEEVVRVRSMGLAPPDAETVAEVVGHDAIDLFVARARAHDRDFTLTDDGARLVASVCRRLDGIPLAIELAAARTASMSLADLHDRLDQRFRLLTGGSRNALPRQQTLAAAIAWSYDLLTEVERRVLRRLTVFVDGFDLAAAEAVCAIGDLERVDVDEVVGSLVSKSLVGAERDRESVRYRLLETVRQFSADALVAQGPDEVTDARARHADHFLARSAEGRVALTHGATAEWMHRFDLEWGNLRAAVLFLLDGPGRAVDGLRLLANLMMYIGSTARVDVRDLLAAALEHVEEAPDEVRAPILLEDVMVRSSRIADEVTLRGVVRDLERVVEVAQEAGDEETELRALQGLVNFRRGLSESVDVVDIARIESLATTSADDVVAGSAHLAMARLPLSGSGTPEEWSEGDARRQRAIECFRRAGSLIDVCTVLIQLSLTAMMDGSPLEATLAINLEALELAREIGAQGHYSIVSTNLATIYALDGQPDRVDEYLRPVVRWIKSHDSMVGLVGSAALAGAAAARHRGDLERAAVLIGAVDALLGEWTDFGYVWTPRERAMYDEIVAALRQGLTSGFERRHRDGAELSLEGVMDLVAGRAGAGPR
ncbi:MAG TPA: adenylate/guanylate cyclase domain-containing protein [Acidimicrobiales bacterium]|nr:adenylate/guanylate cyclase domain-containing protein [Acidimicrobiales bacterium]